MLERESTLQVCRNIIQNAKCDMDKFVKICAYFSYLESSFSARDRTEKDYQKSECGSKESEELWERVRGHNARLDQYVAIIAIESAL